MPLRPGAKCLLFAWVVAWGAALCLAGVLIAGMELTRATAGCGVACTLTVVDEMPARAKLAFGVLLGALMWLARRKQFPTIGPSMLRDAVAGAVAAAMVAELMPGGFGIAFRDAILLPVPNALYLVGGAIGGVLGTLLELSCRRQLLAR